MENSVDILGNEGRKTKIQLTRSKNRKSISGLVANIITNKPVPGFKSSNLYKKESLITSQHIKGLGKESKMPSRLASDIASSEKATLNSYEQDSSTTKSVTQLEMKGTGIDKKQVTDKVEQDKKQQNDNNRIRERVRQDREQQMKEQDKAERDKDREQQMKEHDKESQAKEQDKAERDKDREQQMKEQDKERQAKEQDKAERDKDREQQMKEQDKEKREKQIKEGEKQIKERDKAERDKDREPQMKEQDKERQAKEQDKERGDKQIKERDKAERDKAQVTDKERGEKQIKEKAEQENDQRVREQENDQRMREQEKDNKQIKERDKEQVKDKERQAGQQDKEWQMREQDRESQVKDREGQERQKDKERQIREQDRESQVKDREGQKDKEWQKSINQSQYENQTQSSDWQSDSNVSSYMSDLKSITSTTYSSSESAVTSNKTEFINALIKKIEDVCQKDLLTTFNYKYVEYTQDLKRQLEQTYLLYDYSKTENIKNLINLCLAFLYDDYQNIQDTLDIDIDIAQLLEPLILIFVKIIRNSEQKPVFNHLYFPRNTYPTLKLRQSGGEPRMWNDKRFKQGFKTFLEKL